MASYSSVFRFYGHAILPPLISDQERVVLAKCRKEASILERKQQEAKAVKYSKLLGQLRGVLEQIEQNKRSKPVQDSSFSHYHPRHGISQELSRSRSTMPSFSPGASLQPPTSSTPLLQSRIHTVDALNNKNAQHQVKADQSMPSDPPHKTSFHQSDSQNTSQGKRSTARHLELDSTWESSYLDYQQVFSTNPSTARTVEKRGGEQEQLMTTSEYCSSQVSTIATSAGLEASTTLTEGLITDQHNPDEEQELSDKENSYTQSRNKHSASFPANRDSVLSFEESHYSRAGTDSERPLDSVSDMVDLSSKEIEARRHAQAFIKLTACGKGYLTRALFKTSKVQAVIKTIEDTWSFSQDILKDGPKSMQERALEQRVSIQMKVAKEELSDIFHIMPVKERMEILSKSRELSREKRLIRTFKTNDNAKKNRLSAATMKAMQRRQQGPPNNGQEKPVKSDKSERQPEKSEPKQSVHLRPKTTGQVPVKRRTDNLRVLKPIQAHSSPRLPEKTTPKTTAPRYNKTKTRNQRQPSKGQVKSENVNTQVQAAAKQALGRAVSAAMSERKHSTNTVPRKTSTTRTLAAHRRIAASVDGKKS